MNQHSKLSSLRQFCLTLLLFFLILCYIIYAVFYFKIIVFFCVLILNYCFYDIFFFIKLRIRSLYYYTFVVVDFGYDLRLGRWLCWDSKREGIAISFSEFKSSFYRIYVKFVVLTCFEGSWAELNVGKLCFYS